MPHIPGDTTAGHTGSFTPADWETALGSKIEDYYTPQQQFSHFATGIRPQWQYRQPLADIQNRVQQRYMLGYPGSTVAGQAPAFNNNFRDFLGQVNPGAYAQDPATLRQRAQQAANIAGMTSAQLATDYAPGSAGFNQAAWYRMMYGGDESLQNQMGLVNLLSSQRPAEMGGGEYTGRMSSAIQNMLSELYNARVAGGAPGENFLQWYLDRTQT